MLFRANKGTLVLVLLGLVTALGPLSAAAESSEDFQPTTEVLIPGGEFIMGMPGGKMVFLNIGSGWHHSIWINTK